MHKYIQLAKKIFIFGVLLVVVGIASFRVFKIYQAAAAEVQFQFCVARIVVKTNVPTWMEIDGKSLNLNNVYTERNTTINQTNDNTSSHKVVVYTDDYQANQSVGKKFESDFEVKNFKCFASSSDWSLEPVPTTALDINLDTQKMAISVTPGSAVPAAPAAPAAPVAPAAPAAPVANASTYSNPICTGTNGESPIRQALQSNKCSAVGCWAITSWKVVLGLANLGLVVILIFIAIVNILRIQYDTYAIKKALPILIIGIILANFSLLIVRMFVDFANILTNLFTHNCTPGEFAANMITATDVGGPKAAEAFAGSGGMGIGTLLIWFLFALFVMVAFLILGFLFYIRYAVVIILAIVAPLAFVAMAFPPTQGFFKQWWGWLMKFIFMKPISFFLLYLAGEILKAGTKSQSGMTHLTLWFIVAFLVYLAIIMPFKLGGAVMGAWGGAGKKAAGWLGNKADYAMAKYAKWSPKSAYQAYKMGAEQKREEAYAVAIGKQRDVWGRLTGKETAYREQAERTIGLKRVKEQVGDLDLSSREGLAEAFRRMERNKDEFGMQALLEHAAANNMVSDIMSEADEGTKRKYGAGLIDKKTGELKTDLESQRIFTERVIGRGRDPQHLTQNQYKSLNRIQESWIKSGIANAKNVVRDARTGQYRRLNLANTNDRALYDKMTIRRFWSAPARRGMLNLRKETFFDADNNLTDEGLRLMRSGLLTSEHISMLHNARGNVLDAFAKAGNLERLDAAGAPGQEIKRKLMAMGFGSNLGPTQAVLVSGETAQQREIEQLSADEMGDVNVQASILQRIQAYNAGTGEGAANLAAIRGAVQGSRGSPEIKARFGAMVDLKLAQAQAQQLDTADAAQAESLLGQVSQTVQSQMASALDHGIDVLPILNGVISSVKGPMQVRLKQAIKEGVRQSNTPIISPGGFTLPSSQIARVYDEAVAHLGRSASEDQIKMHFVSTLEHLAGTRLSGAEMHKAWQLAEAYIGKPPRREGGRRERRRRFFTTAEEEEEAAAEEEEQP